MRTTLGLTLGLTTLAAACSTERPDAASAAPDAAAATVTGASAPAGRSARSCPAADFLTFLAAYAEDTALQAAFTRFPLEEAAVEDGRDEPREVVRAVGRAELRRPIFLSVSQRAADSLRLRIENGTAEQRVVVVWKPDTDYQLRYVFARDTCWTLVRRENQSL